MIGRTIGRFRVIAPLGQGGMATVWRARDELLGRDVALKILDPHLARSEKVRRRFLHEARSTAVLDHPGIVAIHDAGEIEGLAYIALALVDGATLSEIAARQLMPCAEAVRIVSAAGAALAHAHARGVIHRDVTGRNIMVARDARVYVLDFGLALAAWESRVTSSETTLGTAEYLAPEVIRGADAGVRSDVYGLGVVLYEALTGGFPFAGELAPTLLFAALNHEPVPPRQRRPDVPLALERIVLRAIARDPAQRYPDVESMRAELAGLDEPRAASRRGRHRVATPHPPDPGPAIATAAAAPGGLGRPDPLYLAVLPFEVRPDVADREGTCRAVAERITETLRCALMKSGKVRVIRPDPDALSAASSPAALARAIGANAVLQGSVDRDGSVLRVSYAVLDAWRGTQLAGDVLDGSAFRSFELEDELLLSLGRGLSLPVESRHDPASRPGDPAALDHYRRALGYLKRKDDQASVEGAIRLFEQLIASEGERAAYQAGLCRAYLNRYDQSRDRIWESRAAAAAQRARELDPDARETQLALGELAIVGGRHPTAIEAFERALRLEAGDPVARLGLATANLEAHRYAEAEQATRQVIAADPDDWPGHRLLGFVFFRQGRFAEALGPWRRARELAPQDARVRRNLGTAYYRLDRYDEAVAMYRESLAIEPSDEGYGNLGAALYYLGRDDEALQALRTAAALTPADPMRWGNLGNACRWMPGHEAEGREALDRAIELMREKLARNDTVGEWWARLAGWHSNRDQHEAARAAIDRALALGPDDVRSMVGAGRVHFRAGDVATAMGWFRRALELGCGVGELQRSRELAPLRQDPEFVALLARATAERARVDAEAPVRSRRTGSPRPRRGRVSRRTSKGGRR